MTSEWLSNPHHWDPPNPCRWVTYGPSCSVSSSSPSQNHFLHSTELIHVFKLFQDLSAENMLWYFNIIILQMRGLNDRHWSSVESPGHLIAVSVMFKAESLLSFSVGAPNGKKKKVYKNNSNILRFSFCFVLNFYKSLEFIWAKLTIYTREQDLRYFSFVEKSFHSIFQA